MCLMGDQEGSSSYRHASSRQAGMKGGENGWSMLILTGESDRQRELSLQVADTRSMEPVRCLCVGPPEVESTGAVKWPSGLGLVASPWGLVLRF